MALPSWAMLAFAALAMASSRRRASSATGGILGTGRTDVERIRHRYDDPTMRAAAERWGARFFPGVPVSALMAAGVTSTSRTERGGPPDYATGLYGVELRRAEAWARDATTLADLGRAVDTSAEAFGADVDAQTYLGFRSYREHADACARALPADLRPDEGSLWLWRLAVSSYSSGEGAVSSVVRGARAELAALRATGRFAGAWETLGAAIAAARGRGEHTFGGVSIAGRWRAAYLVLRCERRFRAGRELAWSVDALASERGWYEGGALTDATAAALQAASEAA